MNFSNNSNHLHSDYGSPNVYSLPSSQYRMRFITFILLGLVCLISGIGLFFLFKNTNNTRKTPIFGIVIGPKPDNVLGAINVNRCFNRVVQLEDYKYYWPDGCRGYPEAQMCFSGPVELTKEELEGYIYWINNGKKFTELDPKCVVSSR